MKCDEESHIGTAAVFICTQNQCWRLLCLKCVNEHQKKFHEKDASYQKLELIEECLKSRKDVLDGVSKRMNDEWRGKVTNPIENYEEKLIEEKQLQILEKIRLKFVNIRNEIMEKRHQNDIPSKSYSRIKDLYEEAEDLAQNASKTTTNRDFVDNLKNIDKRLEEIELIGKNFGHQSKGQQPCLSLEFNNDVLNRILLELDNLFLLRDKTDGVPQSIKEDRVSEDLKFNIFYEDMTYQFGIPESERFFHVTHYHPSPPANIAFIINIVAKRAFGPYLIQVW
jgi:hypothetical protein